MTSAENLAAIAAEGMRFAEFSSKDPERRVPQYPSWTLRDLATHLASIHGRTVEICRTIPQERIRAPEIPPDRDPFDWYQENLAEMLEALHSADHERSVWAFTPPHTISSWERRMVIETGVHRWDAQQAFEEPAPLLPIVAAEGLDEFVHMWLPRLAELPTIELFADDLSRSWKFGDGEPVDTVTSTASELFLRLMARPGAELPEAWEAAVDGLASPAG